MDYDLGTDAVELRKRLRELISAHIPEGFLGACTDDPRDLATTESFCKLLASDGLLALAWPKEHGGGGGSVWQQTVLREEMWAHHEPRGAQYMGINWVGPAVMRYGTAEQKARHLSAIAAGEVIWCQGFSEPEAGTDLASLRTRAVADGDGWRVTGQKVWTSYAQMASWCVLAACTDPNAPKPKRLSLFLVPMDRPGITVRPIRSMLGPHHLNEVFLDDVEVFADEVLGELGDGWRVMREALAFERVGIARYARCESLLDRMQTELGEDWDRLARVDPGSLGTGTDRSAGRPVAGLSRGVTAGRPVGRRSCQRRPHRDHHLRSAGRRAAVRRAWPLGTGQRFVGAASRSGRRPLALRPGSHRGVRNHRSAAHAGRT